MSVCFTHLPYRDTHSFSKLVTDYLSGNIHLSPFVEYPIHIEGLSKAITDREHFPIDRQLLVSVLEKQYEHLEKGTLVAANIKALGENNTFTVCTAHQPNLLTGYLYFIYKIIHAVKLAEILTEQFPGKKFVPVYYMGSEDNDLEELGKFRYNNQSFIWDADGQTGAVGRMKTSSLKPLLNELFRQLGPPGRFRDELEKLITESYLQHNTIGEATRYLVHQLFGKYGLIVLDPDDQALKRTFINVMKDDLIHHTAEKIVSKEIEKREEYYKAQAHPRSINLFYLDGNIRERIEQQGDNWVVLNTSIKWTKDELLSVLEASPERFSPNVILRGMYQETILPDVAFIGGGAEVSYWLQLKALFKHYRIFYPAIHLRQSVLWIGERESSKIHRIGLSIADLFLPDGELTRTYMSKMGKTSWKTDEEMHQLEVTLKTLEEKANGIDTTLQASAAATLAKIRHQVKALEQKMLRAEKRKLQEQLAGVTDLKSRLFPNNSLQERVENLITYYLEHGASFIDLLKENMQPLQHQFMIAEVKA